MNKPFYDLLIEINRLSQELNFGSACDELEEYIFSLDKDSIIQLIVHIGVIPESISHDSTEEKLFAKCADIVLAKSFHLLGMKAVVNRERADCADVTVESTFHGYSLVADAKAFRMSRTAKNQKDFKVDSMDKWRKDADFSVLVCPYYQYPKKVSQIYGQALDKNVCLLSWEHLGFMLANRVTETEIVPLRDIWNISFRIAESVSVNNKNSCFLKKADELVAESAGLSYASFKDILSNSAESIAKRGVNEIKYWEDEEREIRRYSQEEAINKLIEHMKIKEKIRSIDKYIKYLWKQI